MSFLDTDAITSGDLKFALISIVPNEDNSAFGLKVRGAFYSSDDADAHAVRLRQTDGKHDIYKVEMYKWLLVPPPRPEQIGKVDYSEEKLNSIIQDYEKNRQGAEQLFNMRKEEVMRDGLDAHLTPDEKIPEPPNCPDDVLLALNPFVNAEDRLSDVMGREGNSLERAREACPEIQRLSYALGARYSLPPLSADAADALVGMASSTVVPRRGRNRHRR